MTNSEFDERFNFTKIKECCYLCKYGDGWIDSIECCHPYRNENSKFVDAIDVCDEFLEKQPEDWNNE